MAKSFQTLIAADSSDGWLIIAGFAVCVLAAAWALHSRILYARTKQREACLNDLVDNLSEGIYRSSPDGRQLSANKALVALNGYSSEAEMLRGVTDIGSEWYVEPGRRQQFRDLLQRNGQVEDFVSEIYRHKTRERIWVSESARLVHHPKTGEALLYEGSVREITGTVKRLAVEEQLRKLTSQLPGGLFQFSRSEDGSGAVHYISEGSERITGVSPQEMYANPRLFATLVLETDREGFLSSLERSAARLSAWDHEFRIRARDGTEKWVHLLAHPEVSHAGLTFHGYLSDISIRKEQELEIEELAYFDSLTKLPNRRMFLRRMSRTVAECAASGKHGALLFIDLDNFKTLNDVQGHDIGDRYLVEVASRLRASVGLDDLVARIGGDEFVVALERAGSDSAQATRGGIIVAGRILEALRGVFRLGELHHVGSASVGIVAFDGSEPRVEELLKRADIAMYEAKSAGRNGMALFDPATVDQESDRYILLNELRSALAEGQLELHYQPILDHDRRVAGAEALVRWSHPTRGIVQPDAIVSLAEKFGLVSQLSRFVLHEGLCTLAAWQADPRTAHLRLSLNMTLQTIASSDFVVMVAKEVATLGIDPRKLTLELTEHVNTRDRQRVAAQMRKLKELGIRLSLDDFGTGYSSLTFLKSLPFDEVKIDGSFIRDIEKGDSDRALVKTMLSMASNLGLISVAEHVENVRQEAYLRAFGCDFFQGFLYCKAVTGIDFLNLMRAEAAAPPPERRSVLG